MTIEYLDQQLEKWKRVLLLFGGGSLVLAASTFGIIGLYTFSFGWVTAWTVLQLGTVSAGLLLLFGKEWRQLPLAQRLNTAFGFLGAAWLDWLAIGFRIATDSLAAFAFIILLGAILGTIYLLLRRANTHAPEEIFP